MFLWWNFLFVGEVFGFVWKEEEFIHLLGLVPFLCDVTCTFPLQEIHDLFKDYEIKYCYVDRNKRTGENLKTSMYFSSVRNIMCCVWSHGLSELVWCPSVPFGPFCSLSGIFLSECPSGTKLTSAGWIPLENWSWGFSWDKPHVPERKTYPAPDAFAVCSHQETLLPCEGHPALLQVVQRSCGISIPWDAGNPSGWHCWRNWLGKRPSGGPCHPHPIWDCVIVWNALWTENPKKTF